MDRRPLTMDDAEAVASLMAAAELADTGEVSIETADIIADWQSPGYDVEASTLGVFDSERLVAYAEHAHEDRGDLSVHPDARQDPTLVEELAGWLGALARRRGHPTVGLPMPQGGYLDRELERLGWQVRWLSWVLRLPEGRAVEPRPLPTAYSIGQAEPAEYAALHEVIEDAFLEWSARERRSLGAFEAHTVRRPGFEPWLLRVVRDPQGEVVAGAVCVLSGDETFVDQLATRADHRGRGLAQALLADCFSAGREHGGLRAGLSTDSRTGALDLYLKVGMEVVSTWVNRAAPASAG